jgi:hypothetical protein
MSDIETKQEKNKLRSLNIVMFTYSQLKIMTLNDHTVAWKFLHEK